MKKKLLAVLLATSMVAMCFTGCGQTKEEPVAATTEEDTETDAEMEEVVVAEEEVAEEPVPEPTQVVTVEVLEKGYDSYNQASDKYIFVGEGDKYGLIDLEGNVVLPIEYDGYGGMMQDGCFCLGYKVSDNLWESYIYDEDLNVVFTNAGYENFRIGSYNEGFIQLIESNPEDEIADYLYLSDETSDIAFFVTEEVVEGYQYASSVNNGVAMVQTFIREETGEFPIAVGVDAGLVHGPAWWNAYPFAQTDSGYINGLMFDESTGKSIGMAVYNTKTGELVMLPEEIVVTNTFTVDGITVTATEDGYMPVQKEENGLYAIYSVEAQDYVTDYKYTTVGLRKHDREDYILVSNEDETQWGYLDKDMNEVGTWYTDATDFIDGKAIIQDTDGLYYVVDTSFNKLSEGFEAEKAYAMDDVANRFGILKDEKYYMVIVRE
ncbi:MAG: WG repeat-containing protein [Lachnospiraceae bacterium]|nr:WG repeat-containing protein [Lachnospiraceae bacterium]